MTTLVPSLTMNDDRTVDLLWQATAPDSEVWMQLWSLTFPTGLDEPLDPSALDVSDGDEEKARLVTSVRKNHSLVAVTSDGTVQVPMQKIRDAAASHDGPFDPETAGQVLLDLIRRLADAG